MGMIRCGKCDNGPLFFRETTPNKPPFGEAFKAVDYVFKLVALNWRRVVKRKRKWFFWSVEVVEWEMLWQFEPVVEVIGEIVKVPPIRSNGNG